jgi:hypothetical protein
MKPPIRSSSRFQCQRPEMTSHAPCATAFGSLTSGSLRTEARLAARTPASTRSRSPAAAPAGRRAIRCDQTWNRNWYRSQRTSGHPSVRKRGAPYPRNCLHLSRFLHRLGHRSPADLLDFLATASTRTPAGRVTREERSTKHSWTRRCTRVPCPGACRIARCSPVRVRARLHMRAGRGRVAAALLVRGGRARR